MEPAIDLLGAFSQVPQDQLLSILDAEAARRSLPEFIRQAWHVHHPRQKLIWNWHLDAICDHLRACRAGDITRRVINVPPRTLKSYTVSVGFPAWWWVDDPAVQFLAFSAADKLVTRDALYHQGLCMSQWYQRSFRPEWDFRGGGSSKKQDAKTYFANSASGHRISLAFGQQYTGIGGDVILVDDPLDAKDAFNDKKKLTQHVIDFDQAISTRLNDEATGIIIIIMQRLHERDLAGHVLESGGWEHLNLPAEWEGQRTYTSIGWTDPRSEEGELLFPQRLPRKVLAEKRVRLGSRGYAGQYQQRPAPATGSIIKRDWLRYWTPQTLPKPLDYHITSWDCTFNSPTEDSDYVVGQVWGVKWPKRYLLWQVREKLDFPGMLAVFAGLNQMWPGARAHVVEVKANGKKVVRAMQQKIQNLAEFDPQGQSKQGRMTAIAPTWESENIIIPHPELASDESRDYAWVRELYEPEILAFPNSSKDDQADSTSQANLWIDERGPIEPVVMRL